MNTLEGKSWLALAAIKGIGAKALWQIAEYLFVHERQASWLLKNPDRAREALKGIKGGIVLPDPGVLGSGEGEGAGEKEAILLHPLHPAFPRRVKERRKQLLLPTLLYATGNLSILERPGVSIVGSREAGREALAAAEKLASRLAASGINVISGYAAGIDSAAHVGALRSQGTTTLVLAEGLDRFQVKPEFKGLLSDENALVLSQFAPGAPWAAYQAMARNTLVAALSGALVVIASGPERGADGRMSGSFDAGLAALKMGIPAFVIGPAFFSDPPAGNRDLLDRGCNPWNPNAGIDSILEAIRSGPRQPEQRSLFEPKKSAGRVNSSRK
jgi:DNA processing protein